jgi:hypothetical protein
MRAPQDIFLNLLEVAKENGSFGDGDAITRIARQ